MITALRSQDPELDPQPAAFIADTETDPGVNPEVEAKFNHRGLIHLNLNADGRLWGILEPMTVAPRAWTAADRAFVLALRERLTPRVRDLLAAGPWPHPCVRLVG